jgi:ribosomal protein L31
MHLNHECEKVLHICDGCNDEFDRDAAKEHTLLECKRKMEEKIMRYIANLNRSNRAAIAAKSLDVSICITQHRIYNQKQQKEILAKNVSNCKYRIGTQKVFFDLKHSKMLNTETPLAICGERFT